MPALRLTDEQVEFFLQRIAWEAEEFVGGMAEPTIESMKASLAGLGPLVALAEEVEAGELEDGERLRGLAFKTLDETRESIGCDSVALERCKAGDASFVGSDESQGEAVARHAEMLAVSIQRGVIAQTVFEAIRDGEMEAVGKGIPQSAPSGEAGKQPANAG